DAAAGLCGVRVAGLVGDRDQLHGVAAQTEDLQKAAAGEQFVEGVGGENHRPLGGPQQAIEIDGWNTFQRLTTRRLPRRIPGGVARMHVHFHSTSLDAPSPTGRSPATWTRILVDGRARANLTRM